MLAGRLTGPDEQAGSRCDSGTVPPL